MLNYFRSDVVLIEWIQRGFLSNYITILTSARDLIKKRKYNPEKLFISENMFSLYGNPKNWFEAATVSSEERKKKFKTTKSHALSAWPSKEELCLTEYRKYFPYNSRIEKFLKENVKIPKRTLGIHFRGTDHFHTDRIELPTYIAAAEKELKSGNFDNIFIATDEEGVVEKIKNFFFQKNGFNNIIVNDTLKSSGSEGLHYEKRDAENKILLGDQVILDSHCLSACEKVIGKTSNVINYAVILNQNLEISYLDLDSKFRNFS